MIAPLWLVTSRSGERALVVPVTPCLWCERMLPIDHDCPTVRQLLQLAGNTVHPDPDALKRIRARTQKNGTAPAATEAAPTHHERDHS